MRHSWMLLLLLLVMMMLVLLWQAVGGGLMRIGGISRTWLSPASCLEGDNAGATSDSSFGVSGSVDCVVDAEPLSDACCSSAISRHVRCLWAANLSRKAAFILQL